VVAPSAAKALPETPKRAGALRPGPPMADSFDVPSNAYRVTIAVRVSTLPSAFIRTK
jgi:hypothetical protein